MSIIKEAVIQAKNNIRPFIYETQTLLSIPLSRMTQSKVYLKCENLQYTGSFKVRGALNKLLSLTSKERKAGVVTASTGNHGAAIAFGLNQLKIPGMIFVPENVSNTKVENIKNYDVQLSYYGSDSLQTELHAREYAKINNMVYISPYNDSQVIAGQGTIALELIQQLNQIDAVYVPVGGGGLIGGIGGYIKAISPKTKIIGCLPENSPTMQKSIQANRIVDIVSLPTLSDATAGGIEKEAITFEFCKKYVDDYILVSEEAIKNAIITLINTHHMLGEGASGVALAGLLQDVSQFKSKNVVAILSGANISMENLQTVLCGA